jgi:AhpD family alkylhydroperoxidase
MTRFRTTNVLNKQLVAMAVALATQCPNCIELHVKSAHKEGATDAMLAETAVIAVAMRAGGVLVVPALAASMQQSYALPVPAWRGRPA